MIGVLSIPVTLYLIAGIIYLGAKKELYNHIRDRISELGEQGTLYASKGEDTTWIIKI